jgi:hypothetical protein
MTVHQRLGRAQAVLVLGSDDENRSIYIDRAWLAPGETGTEAFEQVSKHRRSYTGGLIFTATELRAYLLSFVSSRVRSSQPGYPAIILRLRSVAQENESISAQSSGMSPQVLLLGGI